MSRAIVDSVGCTYSVHAREQGISDLAQKQGSAYPSKLPGLPNRTTQKLTLRADSGVTRLAWARLAKCYREKLERSSHLGLCFPHPVNPAKSFGESVIAGQDPNRINAPRTRRCFSLNAG